MAANVSTITDVVPPSPTELRHHLGHFATGVTVITARDGDGPVGFACQSFSSVSLDPPLVLFCVGRTSRSGGRVRDAGAFCVNVLSEDQRDLCDRFGSSRGARFDGLEYENSPDGVPLLPDVLVRVHAEVEDIHPAGDHDIVVGRVTGLESVRQQRPMIFFRGTFNLDGRGR
jgi:3-hydroxy-9,10-secoandrosta-1,3,5(10)-triene-9,17-dione monooxygenase reductase component